MHNAHWVKNIALFAIMFFSIPLVRAQSFFGATYITISTGIFVTTALFIVTFILYKNQLSMGPWVLISFATLCITLSEVSASFFDNPRLHQLFLIAGMILLLIVALVKYWDTVELTE
jgi:putative effector of murein hydrolase